MCPRELVLGARRLIFLRNFLLILQVQKSERFQKYACVFMAVSAKASRTRMTGWLLSPAAESFKNPSFGCGEAESHRITDC